MRGLYQQSSGPQPPTHPSDCGRAFSSRCVSAVMGWEWGLPKREWVVVKPMRP